MTDHQNVESASADSLDAIPDNQIAILNGETSVILHLETAVAQPAAQPAPLFGRSRARWGTR